MTGAWGGGGGGGPKVGISMSLRSSVTFSTHSLAQGFQLVVSLPRRVSVSKGGGYMHVI
jgi:hypothetical protein